MDESVSTRLVHMFLKLTNTVEQYKGDPIWIKADCILAVYEWSKTPGGSLTTFVYGSTGVSWEVEETSGQILKLIELHNQTKNK